MNKEEFLTIRWNNWLSLGLGLPTLIYVTYALSTSLWLEKSGLIWLAVFGALFWIVIELHTTMRFAWLRENSANTIAVKQGFLHPLSLIRKIYNAAFWIFLLPFFTSIEYGIGFVAFAIIILVRFSANLSTNNVFKLTPEQYESYPFRIP